APCSVIRGPCSWTSRSTAWIRRVCGGSATSYATWLRGAHRSDLQPFDERDGRHRRPRGGDRFRTAHSTVPGALPPRSGRSPPGTAWSCTSWSRNEHGWRTSSWSSHARPPSTASPSTPPADPPHEISERHHELHTRPRPARGTRHRGHPV